MSGLIIIVHVLVCLLLVMIVLLQAGKGAGMGSAVGGSSQMFFDNATASGFLSKATAITAVIFMITSLTLAYIQSEKSKSIMSKNVGVLPEVTDQQEDHFFDESSVGELLAEEDSKIFENENDFNSDEESLGVGKDNLSIFPKATN